MEVNIQESNSPNQGSGGLQHALGAAASFGFSNMQDMNQQVLSVDAIGEVTVHAEEKRPVVYRRT